MPEKDYVSLSLPKELVDEIKKIIAEHPEFGYKTVGEFIKDAVRARLIQIKKLTKEESKAKYIVIDKGELDW